MHVSLCTCVLVPGETIDIALPGAGVMDGHQPSHVGSGTELKFSEAQFPSPPLPFTPTVSM